MCLVRSTTSTTIALPAMPTPQMSSTSRMVTTCSSRGCRGILPRVWLPLPPSAAPGLVEAFSIGRRSRPRQSSAHLAAGSGEKGEPGAAAPRCPPRPLPAPAPPSPFFPPFSPGLAAARLLAPTFPANPPAEPPPLQLPGTPPPPPGMLPDPPQPREPPGTA